MIATFRLLLCLLLGSLLVLGAAILPALLWLALGYPVAVGGMAYVGGLSFIFYAAWMAFFLRWPWPLAEVLLAAFVGWCCQILATQLVLGWFGLLTPAWVLSTNLLVFAGLLLCAKRQLQPTQLEAHWAAARGAIGAIRSSPTAVVLLVLLALWVTWTIFLGLIFPPYSSDEHYYHMPIVANIVDRQRIGLIPSAMPWLPSYPKNSELFSVWASILVHRDTFADLAMLPFALIGGLGVYAAARRLGASVPVAFVASGVFSFSPTVLMQSKATYNDVMVAGLWSVGFCFTLHPRTARAYPGPYMTTLLVGLLAGLILGTKFTGAVYAIALGLLLLQRLYRSGTAWRLIQQLTIFAGVVLLTSGYWYAFNIVTFGNPLWPFTIHIGGQTLFAGTIDPASFISADQSFRGIGPLSGWQRLMFGWFDRQEFFTVDTNLAGLGPLWIVLGLPSVVLWMCSAALRRDWRPWIALCVYTGMLVLTPLNWVPRYTLFLLVLGGCALSVAYELLDSWARRWISIMTVALALFAILNSIDQHYFSVQRIRTFAALPDIQRTSTRFDPRTFGPTYQWVERYVPPGSVIAYGNGVSRPFPLWGAAFERHVIAVTTIDPAHYIDDLQAAGVQFIFIGSQGRQEAILAADQRARLVFDGGDGWKVFKLQ